MKSPFTTIKISLLISFSLAAAGLFMSTDAYYKRLSIEAASSQLEILKSMPFLVNPGEKKDLPLLLKDKLFELHPRFHGSIDIKPYKKNISLKEASLLLYRNKIQKIRFKILLDTRIRN